MVDGEQFLQCHTEGMVAGLVAAQGAVALPFSSNGECKKGPVPGFKVACWTGLSRPLDIVRLIPN